MKKMMISTALATSLIAGAASADTKVSAYRDYLGSGETPATSIKSTRYYDWLWAWITFQVAKIR